ncbi:hypothetical protein BJ928_11479 [Rhizobium sp. WW_1]|nr:hypothetical protein BJ928_11479 [Rhizobium sp. WW_1]
MLERGDLQCSITTGTALGDMGSGCGGMISENSANTPLLCQAELGPRSPRTTSFNKRLRNLPNGEAPQ